MFVPVACSQCGKPFQVPAEAVGQPAACPWCRATVPALPVGTPVAAPAARPTPGEVLSLDDEPPRASRRRRWVVVAAGVLALLVAALATVGYLRYKQGHLTSVEWTAFAAPDGSCSADLLGRPREDAEPPAGEKRYVSEGWYSGTVAWVGWRDLTQTEVQLAATKDAWHQLGKVFDAERDRLKARFGGAVSKEATVRFDDPLTREVRLATPGGAVVERMIVKAAGGRQRVYFVGLAGRIDPDGPVAARLFDSFRVFE
ncbi:MAG TPA: hypothetical protein VM529_09120 [Gemmata sp.]|nr:hypothetical protein [Gemmata sp.]